jgi:hypothetical protein
MEDEKQMLKARDGKVYKVICYKNTALQMYTKQE